MKYGNLGLGNLGTRMPQRGIKAWICVCVDGCGVNGNTVAGSWESLNLWFERKKQKGGGFEFYLMFCFCLLITCVPCLPQKHAHVRTLTVRAHAEFNTKSPYKEFCFQHLWKIRPHNVTRLLL